MARSAKLTSIDVVQTLSDALRRFQHAAATALDELELEIERALEWIRHDRKAYWTQEVRRDWEKVTEARVDLQRAQTFRRMVDREPSCVDEKRALEKARRRLRTAEEKVERVRHWARMVERAVNEYHGSAGQVAGWLESDLPQALAALGRMTVTLESYVALASTADAEVAAASLPGEDDAGAASEGSVRESGNDQSEAAEDGTAGNNPDTVVGDSNSQGS